MVRLGLSGGPAITSSIMMTYNTSSSIWNILGRCIGMEIRRLVCLFSRLEGRSGERLKVWIAECKHALKDRDRTNLEGWNRYTYMVYLYILWGDGYPVRFNSREQRSMVFTVERFRKTNKTILGLLTRYWLSLETRTFPRKETLNETNLGQNR